MPRLRHALSGYRLMWLFVFFDLPVETKTDRREHARFRKNIMARGFVRLQLSVYARHCASDSAADHEKKEVKDLVPPKGEVRVLQVTDRQFARMEVYLGKKRQPVEDPPAQLQLF
jgi:CRISPR-associated protein Cas2